MFVSISSSSSSSSSHHALSFWPILITGIEVVLSSFLSELRHLLPYGLYW